MLLSSDRRAVTGRRCRCRTPHAVRQPRELGHRCPAGLDEHPRANRPTIRSSNLPASASLEELVDYAHRRHAIEQFHEEAKEELGWDQYQGRLWPGFHRHAVTVMLAMSFLTCLELQHRHGQAKRGRPRDPFSPSARLVSACAASGTSGSGTVAAPPSCGVVDHHGAVQGTVLT